MDATFDYGQKMDDILTLAKYVNFLLVKKIGQKSIKFDFKFSRNFPAKSTLAKFVS